MVSSNTRPMDVSEFGFHWFSESPYFSSRSSTSYICYIYILVNISYHFLPKLGAVKCSQGS